MSVTANCYAVVKSYCEQRDYPVPVTEFPFAAPDRLYRFDAAWPSLKIGMEVDGGVFGRGKKCPLCGRKAVGAHSSITRLKEDQSKRNLAAVLGWRTVAMRPDQFDSGEVFGLLDQLFGGDNG